MWILTFRDGTIETVSDIDQALSVILDTGATYCYVAK